MKLKITPFHLVCIIMIQIILIDSIIVVSLFQHISKRNSGTGQKQVSVSANSEKGPEAKESRSNSEKKSEVRNVKIPNDVLKALIGSLRFKKTKARDFKLEDRANKDKDFIATAYDLSYESCGKLPYHPAYGLTFSGTKAEKGRTIAVDPEVIPLGSSVYIEFPEEYSRLNGWYLAEDTGSKVKGNIIDIFLGESAFYEMEKFGSRKVNVKVIFPSDNKFSLKR